jgi:hypothetical protein
MFGGEKRRRTPLKAFRPLARSLLASRAETFARPAEKPSAAYSSPFPPCSSSTLPLLLFIIHPILITLFLLLFRISNPNLWRNIHICGEQGTEVAKRETKLANKEPKVMKRKPNWRTRKPSWRTEKPNWRTGEPTWRNVNQIDERGN